MDEQKKLEKIEQAKVELETAKKELQKAQENVKQKRAALNNLMEKESTIPLVYDVNCKRLRELCEERTPIYGYKDLFDQVLTVRRNDGENKRLPMQDKQKYVYQQISVRIKKQGMREIEAFCVIDRSSQRVFYITAMKNLDIKSNEKVNLRELNREIDVTEKLNKLKELKEKLKQ